MLQGPAGKVENVSSVQIQGIRKLKSRYKAEVSSRFLALPVSIWLIIFFVFVSTMNFNIAYDVASSLLTQETHCYFAASPEKNIPTLNALLFCLYPLTGWLADTLMGYDMVVTVSLWLCWVGSVIQCINYSVQYAYGECSVSKALKYSLSVPTFAMLSVGATGLYTILPVYGLGQIAERPSSTIRSFINWFVMGIFLASLSGLSFISLQWSIVCCGCAVAFSSIAICLHGWFYSSFERIGVRAKNPYKIVFSTLKYACTHNYSAARRSAFTYWEDSIPSRIDLGKSKYGGPFEEIDIEHVKRFWKVLCVVVSTFGFYIPYYATVYNASAFVDNYAGVYLWNVLDNVVIIIIPFLELLFIPCWPNLEYFLLSPLKGIGLSYILNIFALVAMLLIEFCEIEKDWYLFCIPFLFSGLVRGLSFIYGIQFICSQAPFNMSGMLLGLFWFFDAVFVKIGYLFFLLQHPGLHTSWIFLMLFFVSCIGLIVFIVAARWYRRGLYEPMYNAYENIAAVYTREYTENCSSRRS